MYLAPITLKASLKLVKHWHRHLPDLHGGLFAVAIKEVSGAIIGVAIAGNPPRVWQGTGRFIISRCATDGHDNACSMAYGALCRAGKALGYSEAWTYTLPHELGISLRAAGFVNMGLTEGGEWGRPSRPRKAAVQPAPKTRWKRDLGNRPK